MPHNIPDDLKAWTFTPLGEVNGVHRSGGGGIVAVFHPDPEDGRYAVEFERREGDDPPSYFGAYAYGRTPEAAMDAAYVKARELNAGRFRDA